MQTPDKPDKPPYLEHALDQPLSAILAHMQARILHKTYYFGIPTLKNPLDFWVYQEIITEKRPDFIVEIGNYHGGSTLALAHLCDAVQHGQIIAIDIHQQAIAAATRQHPRITLIEGDAGAVFDTVRAFIPGGATVLVLEDSAHTYAHTLKVLETYSVLLQVGDYFIVEDSICHHGLAVGPNPGPYEAIATFIQHHPEFKIDRDRESFLISWNPTGFLQKSA